MTRFGDAEWHRRPQHGVLVVRGLNLKYVGEIRRHADDLFAQAVTMLEAGHAEPVVNEIDGARIKPITERLEYHFSHIAQDDYNKNLQEDFL